jgi:REP element-mobilizing transposase RayT
MSKQLGLEEAVGVRRAKGRPAAVAAMKDALAKPRGKPKHGGLRPGAGRKPSGAKAGEKHGVRPFLAPRHPVHVTLRITREVGRLRRRRAYQAFQWALIRVLARGDFRVVHVSIQATHVHLICEADDRIALSKGVRALSISAAHRLNAAIGEERGVGRRKGRVFTDRYHAKVIDSARQCRNELAYRCWRSRGGRAARVCRSRGRAGTRRCR